MNDISTVVKAKAREYFEKIQSIRHHLHAHPELSFKEVKTGKYISSILDELGVDYTDGWCGTGLVAIIKGEQKSSKVIMLRADIDALPIIEKNETSYTSQNHGVMHACGHDVHTSCLLGAMHILNDLKSEFGGTIKCIFQPGEEQLPGGASVMIKEGVLENPIPEAAIGQHVHPPLEVGKIGYRSGMYMASADEIRMTVRGKGGHGALPHNCIDTVLMSARILTALQDVIARNMNPNIPGVLSFGKINSEGGATNIIPDVVKIEGTFRTMDEEWRMEAHKLITRIAEKTAESMGGSCEVDILVGYPCLINEPLLTDRVRTAMVAYMGESNVVELPIRLTAEDFSYYSQQVDSCFYRLGTGNSELGITSPVHTPTFDIDERALEIGAGLMAYLAMDELGGGK
ncbi:MAG: M20 family metallopeptidase [Saprospiraceae bacterium]|nr:M20 family metallopeptidase [Saprospiraceae bacterium]